MTMSDPIADMLTRIRNANTAKHDTVDVPSSRMKLAIAQILQDEGFGDPVMENAIKSHNPACGKEPETTLEYALIAADPMSGFIKAIAQIYPDKKVASVKHKSVTKRFKESRFAAGANRQYMSLIEKTGMSMDEFIDIALESMREIADVLGL